MLFFTQAFAATGGAFRRSDHSGGADLGEGISFSGVSGDIFELVNENFKLKRRITV
jgi:hypothetical protein